MINRIETLWLRRLALVVGVSLLWWIYPAFHVMTGLRDALEDMVTDIRICWERR
jgi:hypothetical protein